MADWLTINPTSGCGDYTITVTASTNEELYQRIAKIKVTSVDDSSLYAITDITQSTESPHYNWIAIENLTWVIDVPASGGTADKDNCTFNVFEYDTGGTKQDITSLATVSGSLNVPSSTIEERHSAGTLTLRASYQGLTATASTDVYQNAFKTGSIISYTSTDGNIVEPQGWSSDIVSNTYSEGVGYIVFNKIITNIPDYAFYDNPTLETIDIPEEVVSIGKQSFYRCTGLIGIMMPSVTEIDEYAFSRTGFYSMEIPSGVTVLNKGTFEFCTSLTGIALPENLTEIGNNVFNTCSGLTGISIPNSVTTIGDSAFFNCKSLTNITIPNSVTSFGEEVFYNCIGLENVVIGSGLSAITDSTFYNCKSLTGITLPNNITVIDEGAFQDCISLTEVILPNSVTTIGDWAFAGIELHNLTIPTNVTYIGKSAFNEYSAITKEIHVLPTIPPTAGERIFGWLDNYSAIYVPCESLDDYKAAEGWSLYADRMHCDGLTGITINNLTWVVDIPASGGTANKDNCTYTIYGHWADGASSAITPDNVTGSAIVENSRIETRHSAGTLTLTATYDIFTATASTDIYQEAYINIHPIDEIWYTSYNERVVTPHSTTAFGANIISNTYEYGKGVIKFDGPVTSVGDNAFNYCITINSIELPSTITGIGETAFFKCWSLTSLDIPNGVTTIGPSAFKECSGLTSMTIPDSVTTIGNSAFYNCKNLVNVRLSSNITIINENTFYNCSGLTGISIPNSVTTIGDSALKKCSSLPSITIPSSVTQIKSSAFESCTSLESITCLATTPPSAAIWVFDNTNNCPIYVPAESVDAYKAAAVWIVYASRIQAIP